jgi:hypothetical protein
VRRLTIVCALVATAALSLGLAGTAAGAIIEVDTTVDQVGTGPDCSLRDATVAANTDAASGGCLAGTGSDTITFDPVVFSGPETINLDTVDGPLVVDDLIDDDGLEIQGPGRDQLEITNLNTADQIFAIFDTDETVEISDLTISGGNRDDTGVQRGAGIFNQANLTLTDVEVSDNHIAAVEGLGTTVGAEGAGIWSDGELTIDSSVISGNTASADNATDGVNEVHARGAGIFHAGGGSSLTITNSEIGFNEADAEDDSVAGVGLTEAVGGGIVAENAVTIEQTTLRNNSVAADSAAGSVVAAKGGGIRLAGSGSRIELSTIAANAAAAGTGDELRGAGLLVVDNPMNVLSSTIVGNGDSGVDTDGANLYAEGSGGADVANTIIAGPVGAATTNCAEDVTNNISSSGFNLDDDPDAPSSTCNFNDLDTDLHDDPDLGTLADNGGIGQTMLPEPGSPVSPVIDKGSDDDQTLAGEDQRGLDRPASFDDISNAPLGDGSDIGAVEVQIAWPTFTETTPAVQGDDDTPNVLGSVPPADSVDPLVVSLFTNASCTVPTGTPADPGTFASPGITASPAVPHNNTPTTFYGQVESDYGISHCSTGGPPNTITYTNTLIDPTPPVVSPPPVTITPTPKKKCKKGFVKKKGKCKKKKRKKKR